MVYVGVTTAQSAINRIFPQGELPFLHQARDRASRAAMRVEDGWVYFIHGWTRVMAEIFDIDIPSEGPVSTGCPGSPRTQQGEADDVQHDQREIDLDGL